MIWHGGHEPHVVYVGQGTDAARQVLHQAVTVDGMCRISYADVGAAVGIGSRRPIRTADDGRHRRSYAV